MADDSGGKKFFERIRDAKNPDDMKSLYDDWAASYDADLTDPTNEYVAPMVVAEAVKSAGGKLDGEVFDAGCGTGLSGVALFQAGAKTIDGGDISPGMLELAEKKTVYRRLIPTDMSKEFPEVEDGKYDVVTCVGTLTDGHVGPVPALAEFARITKKGGVIVATIRADIWSTGGYEAEVDRLKKKRAIDLISAEKNDYRRGAGVKAMLLIMRKKN